MQPSESVDVPSPDLRDPEAGRRRARHVFLASFVFAALAWLGTLAMAIFSSETNGIVASWIAIFPTAFGAVGLVLVTRTSAGAAILGAAAAGAFASLLLFVFFAAVWGSL